jgi:peptidoglycan glycosyltransferase
LSPLTTFEPTEYSVPITEGTASTLVQMMINNVQSGVASNAKIPGIAVAGKTGTAENGDGAPYTLWFTGFAPAEDPQVVVTVMVENGGGLGQTGTGNSVAAPIARAIMKAVLSQ